MTRLGRGTLAGMAGAMMATLAGVAAVQAGEGQPTPWQKGLQTPVTEIAERINWFHDVLVNPIIIAIALFVLVLLIMVVVRFNERANPVPSKTTHHTGLEVAWTLIPVLILVVISIPSFRLLFAQYTFPKPDVTIKATGNQWNWDHAYPDHGNFSFKSIMLTDAERAAREQKGIPSPRLLAVDNEVVVPVDKVVHVLVTANDVIHNWTIPSFGSKVDAVPGRTTATWFKAKKTGVFYGQCSELCGKDHAFMPIAVRVVTEAQFNEWAGLMKDRGTRAQARALLERIAAEQAGRRTSERDGGVRAAAAAPAGGR